MIRSVSYIRVSREEQVKGYSIEGQQETTRRYAEQNGWEMVHEYIDPGYSATTDDRPAFKEMIADAKADKFDAILILRSDRFARNRAHASTYKQLLRGVGVKVVSVTEPVEEGTPSAVILDGMHEVIAEWYSVDLSVKITDAKRRRAEKGLWNGPVPFGYVVGQDGTLDVVTDEAEVVKDVYERYASGRYTDLTLAGWLNQTEFRPRVHRRDRKQKNCLWSKDTVGSMLTNVFYVGYVKYKREVLPGKHASIISQSLFDKIKEVRRQHRRGPSTFTQRHRTYLLSGLLVCIQCGEKLAAHHISGHDYYQETCKRRGVPCTHGQAYVRGDAVNDQVSQIVSTLRLPDSWRELVLDFLSSKEEIIAGEKERVRLEETIRRLKRQYREVEISEEEYDRELSLAQARLGALVVPEHLELTHSGEQIEGVVEAWQLATEEERRDMLRLMLDTVYVDVGDKSVVGLKPKPEFLPLFASKKPVIADNVVLNTELTPDEPNSGRGRQTDFFLDTPLIAGKMVLVLLWA